jgi:cytoskeletal protein RodZ
MMQEVSEAGMAALGKILSETRISRGLTLDEVERDTRIARRYLEALERDAFDSLPAPVYCRAFLRTYAQYLGLDANEVLRLYPEKGQEPDMAPLPQVTRPAPPTFSLNWIVAGGTILILLLAGILLYRSGSGGEEGVPAEEAVSTPAAEIEGAGAEVTNPEAATLMANPTAEPSPKEEEPLAKAEPVKVPDLRGSELPEALVAIGQAGLDYVIMQVYDEDVPEGTVINQSPSPGSKADAGTAVTVTVSRGSP